MFEGKTISTTMHLTGGFFETFVIYFTDGNKLQITSEKEDNRSKLKIEKLDKTPRYLVDFNGKNRSWDIIDTQSEQKQVRSYYVDSLGFDALHEAERDCNKLNGIGISKITIIKTPEDVNTLAKKVTKQITNMMNNVKR